VSGERPAVRRLPDAVVNKIAAGEVVERPASVVKELLENSLDAGSTRVTVSVEGAGRRLIAVVDDGHGMTPGDCRLALERHATSKITDEDDLLAIGTLGFRGEALPAIFAVSRLTLTSRLPGASRGHVIAGEGGVIEIDAATNAPEGTSVEVRDLFFNTPARAKFLKSPATEQGAILRAVTQLILAHTGVHVRLSTSGRLVLNVPRARTPRERVGSLYGPGVAARLLDVAGQAGGVRVTGLIGPPDLARSHRDDIHLVVNGRAVRDTLLTQALLAAYRPLLPRDQFPLAVLWLTVDAGDLDVNVHPTKAWVRFRQARVVHDLVDAAVRDCLRGLAAGPRRLASDVVGAVGQSAAATPAVAAAADAQAALFREEEASYAGPIQFGVVVGQVEDTFVVSHTSEEVFFIDQHVAHERVLFEQLQAELDQGPLTAQALLFPQPVELAPARARAVERTAPELARLGFTLEAFGGGTILLRAVPALLRESEPQRLLDDLGREVEEEGTAARSPVLDRLLAFVACRGAIKAHRNLEREEMTQLLADLAATSTPFFCPHGRPIVSRIALREIKRELRRDWS
jgi:DNA mismatch repair protein MutL